jgi:hypothetical protein
MRRGMTVKAVWHIMKESATSIGVAKLAPRNLRRTFAWPAQPAAAAFRIMMLATRPGGDAYTFAELESTSKSAGFAPIELAPPKIGLDRLVIYG